MTLLSIIQLPRESRLGFFLCVSLLCVSQAQVGRAQLDDWDAETGVDSEDEVEFDNDPEEPLDDEPLPGEEELQSSPPTTDEVIGAEDEGTDDTSDDDLFAPSDESPVVEEPEQSGARMLAVEFSGGLGGGTLRADIPKETGHLALADSAFAAAGAQVRIDVAPHNAVFGQVRLDYHTSLGLKVRMQPLFGLPESLRVRYQHFALSIAPGMNLTEGERPLRLTVPLSYSITTLTPVERQYPLQQLVLAGPGAGVELQAPLGERVTLRVGPAARLILVVNDALRDEGAAAPGLGLGGTVEVIAHINDVIHAGLTYREFHSTAPASESRYRSRERFLTARLGGSL